MVLGMCQTTSIPVLEAQSFQSNGLHLKFSIILGFLPSLTFGLMVRYFSTIHFELIWMESSHLKIIMLRINYIQYIYSTCTCSGFIYVDVTLLIINLLQLDFWVFNKFTVAGPKWAQTELSWCVPGINIVIAEHMPV